MSKSSKNTEKLQNKNYKIIHFDSPDRRGIDNALLYNTKVFTPTQSRNIEVLIRNEEGKRIYTRDILVATGRIQNENFAFLVNHWPSRSGGEKASRNYRKSACIFSEEFQPFRSQKPLKFTACGGLPLE